MSMRLLALGVGEAFSALHYTTCFALESKGQWLLVDCPHPIRKMMREGSQACGLSTPLDLDQVIGVALSHLHADHACGLEDYGYFCHYGLKRRGKVLMLPEIADRVWSQSLSGGMGQTWTQPGAPIKQHAFEDYFELTKIEENQPPIVWGPFSIECRRTKHSIPCAAFRIQAEGRTVAISGDTMFDPDLINWLASADLIIHEASTYDPPGPHTAYHLLTAQAQALGIADRMRTTHYNDHFLTSRTTFEVQPLLQGELLTV